MARRKDYGHCFRLALIVTFVFGGWHWQIGGMDWKPLTSDIVYPASAAFERLLLGGIQDGADGDPVGMSAYVSSGGAGCPVWPLLQESCAMGRNAGTDMASGAGA